MRLGARAVRVRVSGWVVVVVFVISVNTNVPSLVAQRVLRTNQTALNRTLERLSTGLRINRASDDPAGLIASENLRREMAGVRTSIDNATRAGNVAATAEGGLGEVSSLLVQLQSLVSQSANLGGISREELAANQLQTDSILDAIDRLSGATTFAGQKLLDGRLDYQTSGVNGSLLGNVAIHRRGGDPRTPTQVAVNVVASARTASLTYTGGAIGAGGVTIELAGNDGTQQLTFASGTTLTAVASAISSIRASTGVSATVSGGNVVLNSTGFGSSRFVSVRAISGSFAGATGKATGRDATVSVNGAVAVTDGLRVRFNSGGLDLSFSLAGALNTNNGATAFAITGGGATFSMGPNVSASSFATIGIGNVSTAGLGGASGLGSLAALRSGGSAALGMGNTVAAQKILDTAVKQVSYERARLGAFIKYEVGSTINSLQVQYENLADAESRIRDTDFAEETANLARYQILAQAATAMLAQANQAPTLALTLLNNAFR